MRIIDVIKNLIAPPRFADPETTRVAKLSNFVFLLGLSVLPLVCVVSLFSSDSQDRRLMLLGLLVGNLFVFGLLRRGHVQLANIVYTYGLAVVLIHNALYAGGIQSSSYGIFFVVVVFAGILLSGRVAIMTAIASIFLGLALVYAETQQWLPAVDVYISPLMRWVVYSAGLTIVACATHLATSSVQRAVSRLRDKEIEQAAINRRLQQELRDREQHAREQTVPLALASAMRTAKDRDEIIPVILDQLIQSFGAVATAYSRFTGEQNEQLVTLSAGSWQDWVGCRVTNFPHWHKQLIGNCTIYLNNDAKQDTGLLATFDLADRLHGIPAAACVVLEGAEQRMGALWVGSQQDLTAQDLRILANIASMVTNALQRIQTQQDTRQRAHQLDAINRLGQFVGEIFDINQICAQICETARTLLPSLSLVVIEHYEPENRLLRLLYGYQQGRQVDVRQFPPYTITADTGNLLDCALLMRQNSHQLPATYHLLDQAGQAEIVCRPMAARGQTVGILQIQNQAGQRFANTDLEFVTLLANTAAIAIQNAILFDDLQRSNDRARQELRERKQAEEVIRRQLSAMEAAQDGIALIDREGQFFYLNRAYLRIYGYSAAEELTGQQWQVLYLPEEGERLQREAFATVFERGEWRGEAVGKRKDDSVFQQELSLSHLESGEIAWVVRDITERKDAEEALRRAQRLESLGVMAGGIAHDFNNLLAGVLGQAALAKAKLPADSPARLHLEKAITASTRAADLTRQLLVYAGKGRVETQLLNLNELLKENHSLFETIIPKSVQLTFELDADLPWIEGDIGQLQQVIMNLIMNAAEAINGQTGTVQVQSGQMRLTTDDHLHSYYIGGSLLPTGNYVTITITDTGSGMDKKTMDRIFDPFFSTKGYGRGLGLSATIGIIRIHKGGLRVESQIGVGSTFQVLLPAVAAPLPRPVEPLYTNGSEQPPSGTVLLMEDEAVIREALTDVLEMQGLHVITATNGAEGIQSFRQHQNEIAVVVVDMQMPVMNGAEAMRELLKIDPLIEVILTSGYSELSLGPELLQKDSVTFLQKPYSIELFLKKIDERIKARQRQ